MGETTTISWTDHTFNPWWGCTKVSAGCDNCYAEAFDHRMHGELNHWGKGVERRVFGEKHWNEPLKWDRAAEKAGLKDKVFCASMADVMDDEAPEGEREKLWELIDRTPNLIWQLLTKRPQRFMRYPPKSFKHRNVWLGTTTENQEMFDVRMEHLLEAAMDRETMAFISYEPALGPITLRDWPWVDRMVVNWVIFGGESGLNRRPMELAWAENMRLECAQKGIAFFMKQMSAATPELGKSLIPAHMLIREFPTN